MAVGVSAALSVPLWLGGSRLAELLRDIGPVARYHGDPADALANGQRALRVLARTHLPLWRNTCLYRALVECLVLRRYGVPCRVEVGVRREASTITAHAWVVRAEGPHPLTTSPLPQGPHPLTPSPLRGEGERLM